MRAAKNGRGSANAACLTIRFECGQGFTITAQNGRSNVRRRISAQACDQLLQEPCRRQRRIPLKVHHHLNILSKIIEGLCAALRPIYTIGRGHHNLRAKTLGSISNTIIIRGYIDRVKTAYGTSGAPTAFNQAHRFARNPAQLHQGFARIA